MQTDVIDTLIRLSRPPRPAKWEATLIPLAARYESAQHQLDALRSSASTLVDEIALVDPTKAALHVVPAQMPYVGALVQAGRELRAALDANFNELRDALRSARAATKEFEFVAAIEKAQKLLPLAEGNLIAIEKAVDRIHTTIAALSATEFVSPSLVIPPRPAEPMISA